MRNLIRAVVGMLVICACADGVRAEFTLSATPLWTAKAGDPNYPFLATSDNAARGMAFNPMTGDLLVVSRTTSPNVYVINAQDGSVLGNFNMGGITGGTFPIDMIGVGSDGAIYAGNLTTAASGFSAPFKLYRWTSEADAITNDGNTAPTLVYSNDPGNGVSTGQRWGDSLSVIGSGFNTKVLLGARNGNTVAVLTPVDPETTFIAQGISTDNTVGNLGLAFQDGSTYWTKVGGQPLKQVTLTDTDGMTTGTLSGLAASTAPLGVDPGNNLLGLINYSNTAPNPSVTLYDITDPTAPVALATRSFPTNNANTNGVGAVAFGMVGDNNVMFALDTNNGIVAYGVEVPEPAALALIAGAAAMLLMRRRT
jgi:hypothetical protein